MFLKSICIVLLTLPMAFAGEISVQEGLRSYHLKYSETYIEFKATQISLSLVKEACNEKLIKNFSGQIEMMLHKMTKQIQPSEQALKITANAKEFYALAKSPAEKFFSAIPEEMRRLKIEESLRCNKK